MEIILRDEDLFGKQKGISLAKDLNSSPIGKVPLEKNRDKSREGLKLLALRQGPLGNVKGIGISLEKDLGVRKCT